MPFALAWEPGGVVRRYIGNVTVAEREQSFDRICSDPRFDQLVFAITDYRDVLHYEISRAATEEIAARHIGPLHTNPNIAIAAVVVDPRIIEAIHHFMSLQFFTQEYRIFSTMAEARAWTAAHRASRQLAGRGRAR